MRDPAARVAISMAPPLSFASTCPCRRGVRMNGIAESEVAMKHSPMPPVHVCLVALFALLCAGMPLRGHARVADDAARIGLIAFGDAALSSHLERSVIYGLRQRGYVEGANLVFERRYADGRPERVAEIATELASLGLDAILTTCSPTTLVMRNAVRATPLVMVGVSDPVGQGLIASYAQPGGNITGLATQFEDVAAKMLQLFHEAVPKASHVAVMFNPGNPVHRIFRRDMEAAAPAIDMRLEPIEIGSAAEIVAASDEMPRRGVDAVVVLPDDPLLTNLRRSFVEMAARHRLPSLFGLRETVEDGGLMSYGPNASQSHFRAAYYLDRVLKGTNPTALPVEQPTRLELVVNLKTAKAIGIEIPPSILVRADEVIE